MKRWIRPDHFPHNPSDFQSKNRGNQGQTPLRLAHFLYGKKQLQDLVGGSTRTVAGVAQRDVYPLRGLYVGTAEGVWGPLNRAVRVGHIDLQKLPVELQSQ